MHRCANERSAALDVVRMPRDAKIAEQRVYCHQGFAVPTVDKNILQLDISVRNTFPMKVLKCPRNRRENTRGIVVAVVSFFQLNLGLFPIALRNRFEGFLTVGNKVGGLFLPRRFRRFKFPIILKCVFTLFLRNQKGTKVQRLARWRRSQPCCALDPHGARRRKAPSCVSRSVVMWSVCICMYLYVCICRRSL